MILGAAIAHLWDLLTFLIAVPILGHEAEVGPIGTVWLIHGAIGAIVWKVGLFCLVVGALRAARDSRYLLVGQVAFVGAGLLGAFANTYAIFQILEVFYQ